ncbi:uncharacterized protein DMAD_02788 [Drosophila madeirensis]|uniref:Uncharacterized protein n=1 Tax=Drosophila madeirensis TaxID=30013 RepID=A0AAU9G728_DROMD
MVLCTSFCYYFDLRWGCILSGLALLFYYSLMAYLLFDDLENTKVELDDSIDGHLDTQGFLVLGTTYSVMAVVCLVLFLAGLLKSPWLCLAFLLTQIPAVLVNCFYLFVAFLYTIEVEMFIMYAVPQILVIYIDLVAYSYMAELRIVAKIRKYANAEAKLEEY